MAMMIESDGKQYLVTADLPEKDWIRLISEALGMTKEAVIGAALNKGLCHYVEMLAEISEHNNKDSHAEDSDNGGH